MQTIYKIFRILKNRSKHSLSRFLRCPTQAAILGKMLRRLCLTQRSSHRSYYELLALQCLSGMVRQIDRSRMQSLTKNEIVCSDYHWCESAWSYHQNFVSFQGSHRNETADLLNAIGIYKNTFIIDTMDWGKYIQFHRKKQHVYNKKKAL